MRPRVDKCYNGDWVPIKDAELVDFQPVSIQEALAWFSRCAPWASYWSGDLSELCEMAAAGLAKHESVARRARHNRVSAGRQALAA